jgi:hypothetical protein
MVTEHEKGSTALSKALYAGRTVNRGASALPIHYDAGIVERDVDCLPTSGTRSRSAGEVAAVLSVSRIVKFTRRETDGFVECSRDEEHFVDAQSLAVEREITQQALRRLPLGDRRIKQHGFARSLQ